MGYSSPMDLLDENDGSAGAQAIPEGDRGERLETAGEVVKKRRGRPPGSKNKPKEDERTARLERLAAVVSLVFFLASIVAKWFGFNKTADLTKDELMEGARHLDPLSGRLEFILSVASWIGFPLWFIAKMQDKFKRKEPIAEAPRTQVPGSAAPLADSDTPIRSDSPGPPPVIDSQHQGTGTI